MSDYDDGGAAEAQATAEQAGQDAQTAAEQDHLDTVDRMNGTADAPDGGEAAASWGAQGGWGDTTVGDGDTLDTDGLLDLF